MAAAAAPLNPLANAAAASKPQKQSGATVVKVNPEMDSRNSVADTLMRMDEVLEPVLSSGGFRAAGGGAFLDDEDDDEEIDEEMTLVNPVTMKVFAPIRVRKADYERALIKIKLFSSLQLGNNS